MLNITVKKLLESLPKNETIHYLSNPGNAGDSLIACGAFKLFKEASLKYKFIDLNNFNGEGKIIIYAGGGNLIGIYPDARNFISQHHKKAKKLILLPHTVKNNEDLLKNLGKNMILFAREKVTYEHLKKYAIKSKVFIDHDLAFGLNITDILNVSINSLPATILLRLIYNLSKSPKLIQLPQLRLMLANSVFELKSTINSNYEIGNFFRQDIESSGKETPVGNADLSEIYHYGTRNEAVILYTATRMIKYINKSSTIRTDRLHICIAAALLGKKVEFYPNSYFKCKAIYEYSIKEKYPNVHWMG